MTAGTHEHDGDGNQMGGRSEEESGDWRKRLKKHETAEEKNVK